MWRRGVNFWPCWALLGAGAASIAGSAGAGVPPKPPLRAPLHPASAPPTPAAPSSSASFAGLSGLKQIAQSVGALVQKNAERAALGDPEAKPRHKKSLSDLRKVGVEQPRAFKTPAQRRSNERAPFRRPQTQKLQTESIAAAIARGREYAEREAKASAAVKSKLGALRAKISQKKKSFQVGATSVSTKSIKQITGLAGTLDVKAAKAQKAKAEKRKDKPN